MGRSLACLKGLVSRISVLTSQHSVESGRVFFAQRAELLLKMQGLTARAVGRAVLTTSMRCAVP